jgi:predicted neutral ceramidase superfamily lipid hydrolase
MTLLGDIFSYAIRGNGKYMLVIGSVLSLVQALAANAPVIGFLALCILACYFCAYYFDVVQSTAAGGDSAPEFPSFSNMVTDIVWPAFQTLIVLFVSMSPLFWYVWFGPEEGSPGIHLLLAGLGITYFPMALLAIIILGRLGAMSPHIVLPSIVRAGGLYWLAVFLLLIIYLCEVTLGTVLADTFLVGPLIMAVVGMYSLLTNGRVMGVIYREKSEELNWL